MRDRDDLRALTALAAMFCCASLLSQAPVSYRVGAAQVRVDDVHASAVVSRDGGRTFAELPAIDVLLHLRSGVFDPLLTPPTFGGLLAVPADTRLFAVQCRTSILPEYRAALLAAGLEVVGYWPRNAYLVRGDATAVAQLRGESWVRWAGGIAVGQKVDPELHPLVEVAAAAAPTAEYDVVLARKTDREAVATAIAELGGTVTKRNDGELFLQAMMSPTQLFAVAAFDTVLWIDAATPIGYDMDNARIQGGANYVEAAGGFTGLGVRAEISEGLEQVHHDWTNPPLVRFDTTDQHGNCTAMIVGGNGSGNAAARGMMPDCQIIESSNGAWGTLSRYAVIQGSVDPAQPWHAMQQTASWGSATTVSYTSVSAALDDALFDFDLATTQSQSNTGNQLSRPQAWAKNVISVGGVRHLNNSNPADDSWTTASIGPATDGRIKPEICAYYDSVLCGDLLGAAGYSTTDYYTGFNGTSAATPIVNGHLGILQQMFTDGLFGNPLPFPATAAFRFENKPHMTTAKSLLVNTAASYPFSGLTHNLTRTHQGWGFPDLRRAYDNRNKMLVVDEYEVLTQGQSRTWLVWVRPGSADFRATMTYADPPAVPGVALHRVNSLDLQLTRRADGTFWWGNNGLDVGNVSAPGGVANDVDTTEQIWLANPTAGIYFLTVSAPTIVQDGHVETPELDADFALVAEPLGGGFLTAGAMSVAFGSTGPGDLSVQVAGAPAAGWTEGYTLFSLTTTRPHGFGNFFGVERDFATDISLADPALPGGIFHFTNAGAGSYPFAPFTFPPAIVSALAGLQVDAQVTLVDGSGQIVEQTPVARTTIQ